MSDKKIYWQLYDPIAEKIITMHVNRIQAYLEGCNHFEEDVKKSDQTIELTPVWLTQEEFENLPEADI